MRVKLKLFAVAKQAAGADVIDLELPDQGATVAHVRRELARQVPQLAKISEQLAFAVNAQYATDNAPVAPNADLACIPPVSGG